MENDYSSYVLSFQVDTPKPFILYVTSDHCTSWFLSIRDSSLLVILSLHVV